MNACTTPKHDILERQPCDSRRFRAKASCAKRTAVVTFVLSEVDADAAPIEVVCVQVPLCALSCRNVKVLAEGEPLLPASVLVCYDPVTMQRHDWDSGRPQHYPADGKIVSSVLSGKRCDAPELLDRTDLRKQIFELGLGYVVGQIANCTDGATEAGKVRLARKKGRGRRVIGEVLGIVCLPSQVSATH